MIPLTLAVFNPHVHREELGDVNSEKLSACLRSKSSKYSWKDLNPDESSFFTFHSSSIASAHSLWHPTGISFQSVIFSSFHCLVTDVKMLQRSKHLIVDNTVLCVTSCCPRFKAVRLIKFKQLWFFRFPLYHDQFTADCTLCRTKHIHRSPKKF